MSRRGTCGVAAVVLLAVGLSGCGPTEDRAPMTRSPPAAAAPTVPSVPTAVPTAAASAVPTPAATAAPGTGVPAGVPTCDGGAPIASTSGQDYTFVQNDLGLQILDRGNEQRIILPNEILFDFDRDALRLESPATLEKVRQYLRSQDALLVTVWGHADGKGEEAANNLLSQRRALAVSTWMNKAGGAGYVSSLGKGESEPLCPETNPDGSDNPVNRQKNRRIEVVLYLRPSIPIPST